MAETVRFRLALTPEQYLAYYQGAARNVVVRAEDGRRIQFPADQLRRHVTSEGVTGRFQLRFDDNHKLIDLVRIGA